MTDKILAAIVLLLLGLFSTARGHPCWGLLLIFSAGSAISAI